MNTNILNTIAAPSVTIAVRQSAKGAVRYVVTIITRTSAQAYPCNTMATALKLASIGLIVIGVMGLHAATRVPA